MISSNPALSRDVFINSREAGSEIMTVNGTVNKSFILLALVFGAAYWSWQQTTGTLQTTGGGFPMIVMGSLVVGTLLALLTIFVKKLAPFTSPVYALAEGVLLGSISAVMEQRYGGIVFQAVLGTFGTFFFMLFLYRSKIVQVTDKFRIGMAIALGGIFFIYLVSFIMSLFQKNIPYIHESGPVGILFSIAVVCIAAFSFLLDFDSIEQGESARAPKYMEWYGAFALLITLVWLYLEILQLLAKLRDRR